MNYEELCQYVESNCLKEATLKFLDTKYIEYCEKIKNGEKVIEDNMIEIMFPNLNESVYGKYTLKYKYILKYKTECFDYMSEKYGIPENNMKYYFVNENTEYPDGVYIFELKLRENDINPDYKERFR